MVLDPGSYNAEQKQIHLLTYRTSIEINEVITAMNIYFQTVRSAMMKTHGSYGGIFQGNLLIFPLKT